MCFSRPIPTRAFSLPILLAASLGLAGCDAGGTNSSADAGDRPVDGVLKGTVSVEGSSTVYRISQVAQVNFKKVQPGVKVLVGGKGTGPGFERYKHGDLDIIDASRDAKPSEIQDAEGQGMPWTRLLIGYDGITVVVSKSNDFLKALSVAQLKALLEPDARANTWQDLDPSWPARKVKLFTPDNDSGTFEFFNEAIHGDKSHQRKEGVQTSADDNTLVSGVAGEADGLGYFGYAYAVKNKARLRIIPIQAGPDAEPIEPNPETILKGTYKPLARPLYLFVKNEAYARRPEVKAFVDYYLEKIDELTAKADYVPPTDSDKAANRAALDALAATGTAPPPA